MKIFSKKYPIGSSCDLQERLTSHENWRIHFLFLATIIVFSIIFLRLYTLQIISFESYRLLSEDQHTISKKLVPQRGEIFLREKNGIYPIAINKETKLAYLVPKEVENEDAVILFASENLGIGIDEVRQKLIDKESFYKPLKHKLSDEEIEKIKNSGIKGINLADESFRYYPAGELASNVLGFVGWKENEMVGRYGIEAQMEDFLKGQEGSIFQERDTMGRWISIGKREIQEAKDGDSLVLTIDRVVQYEAERILKSAVDKFEADNGTVIVMEPSTGKIIAMANVPNFDPNNYSKIEDISDFKNIAINIPYESGSVFKPIVMAAGLDSEKINPETTYVDTGSVKEAGYTIKNAEEKVYGLQTMTQVLENSINTGVIFVEKLVGNKNFYDYLKRFGFGEQTGIELFGESPGNINNLKDFRRDINFFTAAFGQGITVTPIQLLSAYGAMANGGILMKPKIIEKIIHSDGNEEEIKPEEIGRVISQKASLQISQMLQSVVDNGHGKRAGVPGYLVGGKTGTAQIANLNKKGYQEEKNMGSFAGYAPIDNPRFVMMVKMENPKAVEWAESSAAPTFGELMKFLLEYYNIEPTEKYTQAQLDQFNATHNLKDFYNKKQEDQRRTEEANKKLEEELKKKDEQQQTQ